MKNFKKFIAVALAVFVSVFMLAVSAFASDTDRLCEWMTVHGTIWRTVNIIPITQVLLSIMTLITMLKMVCSIGAIPARQSITVQHILLQTARLMRTIRASFL